MGLEYLDKVYKSMFAGGLGYLVIVSKSIGAFILVLSLWKSFFKSFSKKGKYLARVMKVFLLILSCECWDFFCWLVLVHRF